MAISSVLPSRPTTCHLVTDRRSQCECAAMGDLERAMQTDLQVDLDRFRHTSRAVLAVGSNVDFDVRPTHMRACEPLHGDYSDVRQVQHFEDSSTKCSRHDDSSLIEIHHPSM